MDSSNCYQNAGHISTEITLKFLMALMRNHRFIRPAQETAPISAESVKREERTSSEQQRRVITRLKRLIEAI